MNSTLIFNATYYTDQGVPKPAWILFSPEGIIDFGFDTPQDIHADNKINANKAILLPGLIDTHVHFREPGLTHKASIASESKAALAGGITSFVDMPNTIPTTTTIDEIANKINIAAKTSVANYGFYLGASSGISNELAKLHSNGSRLPIKLFWGTTTGGMGMPPKDELEDLFRFAADNNFFITVHAEDNKIIAQRTEAAIRTYGSIDAVPINLHSFIRPTEACVKATSDIIDLAHRFNTHVHLAHISTASEVLEFLKADALKSKLITAETSPMYMDPIFSNPENKSWRTKINPAIKDGIAQTIIEAVIDGRIDTIATDHAPHERAAKAGGALNAASGAPSVQFALPMMLSYLSPTIIRKRMAEAPTELFGITKRGYFKKGYAADIVLVEETEPYIISDADVISPCGWTPFSGRMLSHKVSKVWVNGISSSVATPSTAKYLFNDFTTE